MITENEDKIEMVMGVFTEPVLKMVKSFFEVSLHHILGLREGWN